MNIYGYVYTNIYSGRIMYNFYPWRVNVLCKVLQEHTGLSPKEFRKGKSR
jgi:hypothetical protein